MIRNTVTYPYISFIFLGGGSLDFHNKPDFKGFQLADS